MEIVILDQGNVWLNAQMEHGVTTVRRHVWKTAASVTKIQEFAQLATMTLCMDLHVVQNAIPTVKMKNVTRLQETVRMDAKMGFMDRRVTTNVAKCVKTIRVTDTLGHVILYVKIN